MVAEGKALHFYFDFISPYGWIGAENIGAVARRFGRVVHWHPILLKATVLEAMGLPAPLETPLKGPYLRHDIQRSLRFHGLTLASAARFGFASIHAARAVLWAREAAPERVENLVLALYRAHWAEGVDISNPESVLEIAALTGLPGCIEPQRPDIKQALHDETVTAIRAGIFGSPTFVVDGEMFWGADRLPMLERWIETGGW